MPEQVDVSLSYEPDYLGSLAGDIVCRIDVLDSKLIGQDAEFSIIASVEVHDNRGVNVERTLFTQQLRLSSDPVEIRIPRDKMRGYTYTGKMITMKLRTRLVIDDAALFDTRISEEQELKLGTKPSISTNVKSIIEPKDAVNFFSNLRAIPIRAQIIVVAMLIVGSIIVMVNTMIGIHDQISPEDLTWFYSHVDSDGEPTVPLAQSLLGSGGIGAAVWFTLRDRLRQYMQFSLKILPKIQRNSAYGPVDLVRGRSRVPLSNVTLRVVACNMEFGQYKRGSGTNVRVVSFNEPVRGVILYESTAKHIPANTPIASHFDGSIDFESMFTALYPPFITLTHGLQVHWEVQLLHPDFMDQELVGLASGFRYADFLDG